ncbi:DUF2470 domain-containing protein [Trichocoleus sp. FACHB-90]|uniref:DUF2470 domain-containing protein n=1 Tax=Cyanophyceae TaxID=3028117 RepID=UPI001688B539|nr:DUF2470 domain-containing protein [Trichocoleus sp. FACHB-90]MBD1925591.1 DUF2470 domain-containing protein [Trichocoleus sp. FACHB-90]
MSEQITAEISDRICKHMNDDHADAIVLYAKTFGDTPNAIAAEMLSIDSLGMNLIAQMNDDATPIRIQFDHALKDAEDAHHTLIEMVKQARSNSKQNVDI